MSATIHILPELVSSRIAAGEVVERPAAVVKELLDNSLDAGSSLIVVEVQEGGRRLMRVIDNGEGMRAEDAQLACQRFATSKLKTEEDLLGIQTLGFRGEALPSIASVSKFCLRTMKRGQDAGTCVRIDGGRTVATLPCALSPGTQVEVEELFFNTPGRQKFLKSAATEFSHICHVVQQAALARPETHFRLTHNERVILEYPSAPTKADRIRQIYGIPFLDQSLPVFAGQSGLTVEGFTVNPHFTRTSRTPQDLFVNGRPIRNATVAHAVYEAYGSFLPKGRHPLFILFLEVDPGQVDVNVHPAKREVRFSHPEVIHAIVKTAIRQPLQSNGGISAGPSTPDPTEENQASSHSPISWPESSPIHLGASPQGRNLAFGQEASISTGGLGRGLAGMAGEAGRLYAPLSGESVRVLGQINSTYMIAQIDRDLHVLDQHTTHERVLFERLLKGWTSQQIPTQALLIPEPIEVPPHAAVLFDRYLEELGQLGLELERFGATTFLIRAVPALLGTTDYQGLAEDLLHDLAEWKSVASLEQRVRPVLASLACQGAVQAGRAMGDAEMKQVIEDWILEGRPMTCPHGRRVALCLSSDELQRTFNRAP